MVEPSKPVIHYSPPSVDTVESCDSAADETNELAEDEDEDAGETTDVPTCSSSDLTMPTLNAPGSLSVTNRDGLMGIMI